MINFKSTIKGIKAMTKNHGKVNYKLSFCKLQKPWFDVWTPFWHEGRGVYISIGLFFIVFMRGY